MGEAGKSLFLPVGITPDFGELHWDFIHPFKRFSPQKSPFFPTKSAAPLNLLWAAAHPEEMGTQIHGTDIDCPGFLHPVMML